MGRKDWWWGHRGGCVYEGDKKGKSELGWVGGLLDSGYEKYMCLRVVLTISIE